MKRTGFSMLILVVGLTATAAEEVHDDGKIALAAKDMVLRVAKHYAGIKNFSVQVSVTLAQEVGGDKDEEQQSFTLAAERPNRLALRPGEGMGLSVISDGKRIFFHAPASNVYTSREAPPDTSEMFKRGQRLSCPGPTRGILAMLFRPEAMEEMLQRATAGELGVAEDIAGAKCSHVKFGFSGKVTLDIWAEEGEKPFLRRCHFDLAKAAPAAAGVHRLDLIVSFDKWVADMELPKGTFAFTPPQGAREVPFPDRAVLSRDREGRKQNSEVQPREAVVIVVPAVGAGGSVVESRIDGAFEGWDGETIFKLQNGQIWQQARYSYAYHYAYSPKVLIYKVAAGWKMKVEGVTKEIFVERLK